MKLILFYFTVIFAIIHCTTALTGVQFSTIKIDFDVLVKRKATFNKYSEQAIWFMRLLLILQKKIAIVEKLFNLNKLATKLVADMNAKGNIPSKIFESIKNAKESANNIVLKTFTDQDIRQMELMKNENFYGFSPVDIDDLIQSIDFFLFHQPVLEATLAALDNIQVQLNNLTEKFNGITSEQFRNHKNRNFVRAVDDLIQMMNSLELSFENLDKSTNSFEKLQKPIRNEIDKAFKGKLIIPNERHTEYELFDAETEFKKKFSQKVGRNTEFEQSTIDVFTAIWKKTGHYASEMHRILVLLQECVTTIEMVKNESDDKITIYSKFIVQIMALRYLSEEIFNDIESSAKSWFEKLAKKFDLLKKQPSKSLLEQTIQAHGAFFSKLYDDSDVKIDSCLVEIEKNIEDYIDRASDAINDNGPVSISMMEARNKYTAALTQLIRVRKLTKNRRERYEFQASMGNYD